jgi:hypothetical protein
MEQMARWRRSSISPIMIWSLHVREKNKPPYVLLIIAVLLVVFGVLYDRFILVTIPMDLQIDNVILTAITFICIFVAILLVYIFLINLMG